MRIGTAAWLLRAAVFVLILNVIARATSAKSHEIVNQQESHNTDISIHVSFSGTAVPLPVSGDVKENGNGKIDYRQH
jgi:hypothetical protein